MPEGMRTEDEVQMKAGQPLQYAQEAFLIDALRLGALM